MGGQARRAAGAVRPGQGGLRGAGRHEEPAGHRGQLEELAQQVEEALRGEGAEVTSQQIGVAVLERLPRRRRRGLPAFRFRLQGIRRHRGLPARGGPAHQDHRAQTQGLTSVARAARRRPGPGPGRLCPPRRSRRLVRGHAGALGRGGSRGPRGDLHQRRQGNDGSRRRPGRVGQPAGGRGERGGAPSSAWPDSTCSDTPTASSSTTRLFRATLVSWVRKLRPLTVLGPDPTAVFFGEDYFNHRDHRTVGFALLDALSPAAALPHYFPEAGVAYQVETALLSGTLEPNVWVDVTATIDDKVAAVSCHRSQFADGGEWARRAVRNAPMRTGAGPAWPTPRVSGGCGSVADAPAVPGADVCGSVSPEAAHRRQPMPAPSCTSTWTPSSPRWRSSTTRPCSGCR